MLARRCGAAPGSLTAITTEKAAPSAEELRKRVQDELGVSLRALRQANQEYTDRRWSPGKLTPYSDALWRTTTGYLDLLDVLN